MHVASNGITQLLSCHKHLDCIKKHGNEGKNRKFSENKFVLTLVQQTLVDRSPETAFKTSTLSNKICGNTNLAEIPSPAY